eukprot:TRINITY_DN72194_c0_g1_i1.p1 TRINITY_DN72194_c0_g1~~TRINITY_DN72194_c0_g1_i1.p1  ORF type:complete len:719 (-),score=116.16 TRINITY_DN72194_c0_g1_i1:87-2243(-)
MDLQSTHDYQLEAGAIPTVAVSRMRSTGVWEVDVPKKASTVCAMCGESLDSGLLRFKWCAFECSQEQVYLHSNCALHAGELGTMDKVGWASIRKSLGLSKDLREDLEQVVRAAESEQVFGRQASMTALKLPESLPVVSMPESTKQMLKLQHENLLSKDLCSDADAFPSASTVAASLGDLHAGHCFGAEKPPCSRISSEDQFVERSAVQDEHSVVHKPDKHHEILTTGRDAVTEVAKDDGFEETGEDDSPRAHIEKNIGLPDTNRFCMNSATEPLIAEDNSCTDHSGSSQTGSRHLVKRKFVVNVMSPGGNECHRESFSCWAAASDNALNHADSTDRATARLIADSQVALRQDGITECANLASCPTQRAVDFDALPDDGIEDLDDMAFWPTQHDSSTQLAKSRTCLQSLEHDRETFPVQAQPATSRNDLIMAILETEGTNADPLPRTLELSNRSQEDLESLAQVMGLKQASSGWCKADLSKAEQEDVLSVVLAAEGLLPDAAPDVTQLESKTKARLEIIAIVMHIKRDRIGWARCCPLQGSKSDLVTSLIKAWHLAKLDVEEIQSMATAMGVKHNKVHWAVCCPPFGDKEDVIRAMLRMEALQQRAVARATALKALTQLELEALAVKLKIKEDGIGWPRCCPPTGNKQDMVCAILRFEELWPKPVAELQAWVSELGVAVSMDCRAMRKSDMIAAIIRAEGRRAGVKRKRHESGDGGICI